MDPASEGRNLHSYDTADRRWYLDTGSLGFNGVRASKDFGINSIIGFMSTIYEFESPSDVNK